MRAWKSDLRAKLAVQPLVRLLVVEGAGEGVENSARRTQGREKSGGRPPNALPHHPKRPGACRKTVSKQRAERCRGEEGGKACRENERPQIGQCLFHGVLQGYSEKRAGIVLKSEYTVAANAAKKEPMCLSLSPVRSESVALACRLDLHLQCPCRLARGRTSHLSPSPGMHRDGPKVLF